MKATLLTFLAFCISSSAFAADVPTQNLLNGYDREYYLRSFDYVMNSRNDTAQFHWVANDGYGDISVGKPYLSKSKEVCRNFTETFSILRESGSSSGAGCKRVGDKGWCRVGKKDAHTCAFDKKTNKIDEAIDKSSDILDGVGNLLR